MTMSESTVPDADDREHRVIVNGQEHQVAGRDVTYEQILEIAYPDRVIDENTTYVMLYRKAAHKPHEGVLTLGGSVQIRNKETVFNVDAATRS